MKTVRNLCLLMIMAVFVLLAFGLWDRQRRQDASKGPDSKVLNGQPNEISGDLPPVRPSRFANAAPEVEYVGTQTCVECHQEEHDSYALTSHSRALSDIEVATEPAGVQFDHALSGRRFRVQKRDGQIWHQEFIHHDEHEHLLAEYPVRYAIGSGNHTRSFLVEEDGFLLESPITWYASEKGWWVSPGYDVPVALGFQRTADVGCITCHAGRVETEEGVRFKVDLHELTIGCESCHGPGELHVKRQQSTSAGAESQEASADLTIVNPGKLDRVRAENICAQCHLRGDASIVLRTRDPSDFRPGQLLSDYRTDYVLKFPNKRMTVVGHVDQMRLSKCYQSTEMTCTTCHDPHGKPSQEAGFEYYQAKCMECHEDCGLDRATRLQRQSDDDCVACHMPRGDTDIPHIAFTQHYIGIHDESAETEQQPMGLLVPLYGDSHLPESERNRNLGLAYLEFSDKQATSRLHNHYRAVAETLLNNSVQIGLRDGDVVSALARMAWERNDLSIAVQLAKTALDFDSSSGASANARFVLGDAQMGQGSFQDAVENLHALTRLRRQPDDWFLLGLCYRHMGRVQKAIESMEKAVQIDPSRQDIRDELVALLSASSNESAAARHRSVIQRLKHDE